MITCDHIVIGSTFFCCFIHVVSFRFIPYCCNLCVRKNSLRSTIYTISIHFIHSIPLKMYITILIGLCTFQHRCIFFNKTIVFCKPFCICFSKLFQLICRAEKFRTIRRITYKSMFYNQSRKSAQLTLAYHTVIITFTLIRIFASVLCIAIMDTIIFYS